MTVEKRRAELRQMNDAAEQKSAEREARRAAQRPTNTVLPLPPKGDSLVPRALLNKGLMVHWINADLMSRAGHDVRKSIVFYDDAQTFETALTQAEWDALSKAGVRETFLERLYAATPVRFWSKGVK